MTDSTNHPVPVRKTYKLFLGGKFPRSESGRSFTPPGAPECNVARASRKDLREAVVAARKALADWSGRSGFNRGQILYRLAEIIETRRASLVAEIGGAAAERQVERAIDVLVWHAGICDKLQCLLGSQNDVSGPFFNFTAVEPTGVIGVLGAKDSTDATPGWLAVVHLLANVLAGGNTAVVLADERSAPAVLALGELLAVSDVPAGVVNLLAGHHDELVPQFADHRDLDGLLVVGAPRAELGAGAADSVKRVRYADVADDAWFDGSAGRLQWIEPFVEAKTFWHPIAP